MKKSEKSPIRGKKQKNIKGKYRIPGIPEIATTEEIIQALVGIAALAIRIGKYLKKNKKRKQQPTLKEHP